MNNTLLLIAARILIPGVFIALGLERLLIFCGVLPGPEFSPGVIVFSLFELLVGVLIAFGWKLRFTAALLALFIVIDAVASHPFWAVPVAEMHGQFLHFFKNLSILGGLLLLVWMDQQKSQRP